MKQKDLIKKYGYVDDNSRMALYSTVGNKSANAQGLYIEVDQAKKLVILRHEDSSSSLAEWSVYVLAGKFMTKMDRVIMGFAETKEVYGREYFHFVEAMLLENPTPEKFLQAFDKSEMFIDIRMHINEKGSVRNHGTAFRMSEKNLMLLYSKKKKLL